ncbi:F/Y rich C-terminus-domain-containing protein [Dichotomocladium elegans]|nr:F/Y rich C-terminus-domain-containing protein [Dichotomocladium elegans]
MRTARKNSQMQNEVLLNDLNEAKKRLRRLAKERDILLDKICKYDQLHAFEDSAEHRKPTLTPPPPPKEVCTKSSDNATITILPTISNLMDTNDDATYGSDNVVDRAPSPPLPVQLPHTSCHWQEPQPQSHPRKAIATDALPPSSSSSAQPSLPHHQIPRGHHHPSAFSPNPVSSQNDHLTASSDPVSSNTSRISGGPKVEIMYQDGRMVPSSRPKRMRRGPVEPKMRRVQPLEKDPDSGEYILPARVGILTVHSLGRVVPLPTYHNDRYIWPPGFKVSRTYLSMVNPNANTIYTCSVEENGEQGPRFRVVAEDYPDQPIIANSATGVWTAIVKRANEIRNREHSNSGKSREESDSYGDPLNEYLIASGPDYYGFTHATVAKMIQDLPGAENCINYVWQKFGEMHQRTAAGVAAAAQKKLTNLEIMGSANKRPPPSLTAKKGTAQRQSQLPALPPPSYRPIQPQVAPTVPTITARPAVELLKQEDDHFRVQCQYKKHTSGTDSLKSEEMD